MTTTQILVSAAVATVWLVLFITGLAGCFWMSRKTSPRKRRQPASKTEASVGEHPYRSGLLVRVWKGNHRGLMRGGLTLLRRTDRGLRQTLGIRQCFDIPVALLFFCDLLERQTWLSDDDREQLQRLRASMQAAVAVLESPRSTGQVNGHTSVDVSDAL